MNAELPKYDFLDPPQKAGELGRLGPYRVLGLLGTGGMGEVFRAQDSRLKRTVALKLMKSKLSATPLSRMRFVEEARSMAAVHHDNVATIFEVGVQDGVPFMAMELLQGQSLNHVMKEQGTFETDQVLRLAKEVTLGLAAAHACGIVHRDIKPANIWLEETTGRAKILDFGLAITGNGFDPFAAKGTVVGSPGYLSPEQARNEPLDDRTDLYSLGVVLYVMCTGRLPLSSGTIPGQLIAIICHPPRALQSLRPDLPQPLCDLIHLLLHKEAKDRPNSAKQLAIQIDDIANRCSAASQGAIQIVTEPTKARSTSTPTSQVQQASPHPGRKKKRWPQVSVGLACILGIAAAVIWFQQTDRIASNPSEVRSKTSKRQPSRVTATSLQPLGLVSVTGRTRTAIRGQAARYRLQMSNDASDPSVDPRRLNAGVKVAAQLATLLRQDGNSRILRPTFPKKIPVAQLPRPGESREFEIQFLTNNLPPETYEVEIQLQSPDGSVIASISDRLVIEENLRESDLLGFEIVRTHQGKGADSYVRQGATKNFGGEPIVQGLLDKDSNREHIYLRLDLSRLSRPRSDLDRAILLLSIQAGGHQGKSVFSVYGIKSDLPAHWQETGADHLNWTISPCRSGIGGQQYLGQCSLDNTKDNLRNTRDGVRFFGPELDEFIRNADADLITLVLIRQTTTNRPTRFQSKEGKPDRAPGLAIRFHAAQTPPPTE